MERNLTGIYYIVQRDGKWCSVDFADIALECPFALPLVIGRKE